MTRYLSLAEYYWLAEQVTGIEAAVLIKASRQELADSALHAPQSGWGGNGFYPDIVDKAAVLICRLALTPLCDREFAPYCRTGANSLNSRHGLPRRGPT